VLGGEKLTRLKENHMISLALVLAAVCALLFGSIPLLALAVSGLLLKLYPILALLVFALITAWAINEYWR
jgi:ABC-type antimicrobial peptide transport system permease subunit